MDLWARLREGLADLTDRSAVPADARRAGTLALLADADESGDASLLLTRRRENLVNHPGQVCFPGGRLEAEEAPHDAALREAAEECAVDPATVTVLGSLPTMFIPPSAYWMTVTVGRWDRPHPLVADQREVAELLTVRLSELRDPDRWRATALGERGLAWAWHLDERHVLWGATAVATAALLGVIDPDWHQGRRPEDLSAWQHVQPWRPRDEAAGWHG